MSDRDNILDYEDAYNHAHSVWGPWIQEVQDDFLKYLGDQFSYREKAYLNEQRRNILVFNKIRRVIQMVTGHQRKNRLALKVDPIEGGDKLTAEQMSDVVMHIMTHRNVYNVCSDCFEQGPLKSGLTLLNIYNDFSNDPVSGDLAFKRVPFNRFYLDPNFTEPDLSDCGYIIRREWPTVQTAAMLVPSAAKEILKMTPKGRDQKFTYANPANDIMMKNRLRYDEFWRPSLKKVDAIIDPTTGAWQYWSGDRERKMLLLRANPQLQEFQAYRKEMQLTIFIDGVPMYSGNDPLGIDEYPFIPFLGFYDSEHTDMRMKLQGLVRCMKDPQTELNRRISKMLDILDSQISSGYMAEEESVTNPRDLYLSGQSKVIWLKKGKMQEARPLELRAPDVPQGLFQMSQIMDKEILEIPGANLDLMGQTGGEDRVAATLSTLRQSAGLTVLQKLFDNHRFSKKQLGVKIIKAVQSNYLPAKIQRMIDQQPTKEFYDADLVKYDCVPIEGVLTETQRQMYYQQLRELKDAGAPIPWSAIMDVAPIEKRSELAKVVAEEEKKAQQAATQQMEDQSLLNRMMAAKAEQDVADAKASRAKMALDMTKAMKEIADMPREQALQAFDFLLKIRQHSDQKEIQEKQITQQAQAKQLPAQPTGGTAA